MSSLAARKSAIAQDAAKQRNIRLDSADKIFAQRTGQPRDGLIAVGAVADQLRQQRIVVDGNVPAFVHAAIAADAGP